jgi:formylglycine-generating enzyme required for sulfatase activity
VQGGYNPDASTTLTRTYPGAEYPSGAPTFANMTILDGNAFFTSSRADKHRVATVKGTLETCYIRGGHTNELNGTVPEKLYGGGLYINGGTVVSCIIRGNVANNVSSSRVVHPALGGGVYLTNGGKIYNSLVTNNMANDGFGVYVEAGCVTTNSTIVYNTLAPISVPVCGTGPNIAQNAANVSNYYYHQENNTSETDPANYNTTVKVQLTDFYLGATETTGFQYCVFLASIDYRISGDNIILANNYRDSLWTLKVYGTGKTGDETGNRTVREYYGTTAGPGKKDEDFCANDYPLCVATSGANTDFGYLYYRDNIIVPKELTNSGTIPDDDIAVCNVFWYGSLAYSQWLGGSLPTEAQWEFALRRKDAGSFVAPDLDNTAIDGQSSSLHNGAYAYFGGSFSSVLEPYAWYSANSASADYAAYGVGSGITHNHRIGEKEPTGLGLYDMDGNLREWCADFHPGAYSYAIAHYSNVTSYDSISGNVVLNPINNAMSVNDGFAAPRILRGGSWKDSAVTLRAGSRDWGHAQFQGNYVGFRPVFLFPFAP